MSVPAEAERIARAALTWVAEPGDQAMGALLRVCGPAEICSFLSESDSASERGQRRGITSKPS